MNFHFKMHMCGRVDHANINKSSHLLYSVKGTVDCTNLTMK